jgi:hypothetical protein
MTGDLDQLAQALDPKAKRAGNGSWSCCCPAHEDKHASPSLSMKDGRLLWRCHSGCSQADVQAELQKRGLLSRPNGADHTAKPRTEADQSDDWRQIMPIPDGTAEPAFTHPAYGKPSRIWTYRDPDGRVLFHVARFDPPGERKQILPRCWGSWNSNLGWYWRHPATPRPLYRLDQLAARPSDPVILVEGEKSADAAAEILPGYVVMTWPGGSNATGQADWSALKDRDVWIWPDNDEPGQKAAEAVGDALLEIASGVRIVDLPPDLPEGWDLADPAPDGLDARELIEHAERHVDGLERLVEQAARDAGAAFEPEAVDFLAELRARDPAAYERTRSRLKKVHVRVAALDQEVERRKPEVGDDSAGKGKALDLPEPEPWGEPVDGAELIAGLVDQIRRFVILSDHAAVAAALWVIHTHAHDAAFISPRLTVLSPTKRCGKSSLFRTLARMARRPLPTSNISPTAMFRVIEAANPTLFCDEMSSIGDQERSTEIRGVVNSSHCRADAQVIRNVPVADGYEPRVFSTWAPMALAYIKHVDDQIRDRSVIITMQRKAPDQVVAQLRLDQDQGFGALARKAARWASDHFDALRRADPEVPCDLNDRAADNWRCLLAIAELAGGIWHDRARAAAVALSTDADAEDTIGVELLCDLRGVFDALGADRLLSSTIVAKLAEMEGRPWAEFGRSGKPLTTHQLAWLLKPFKVSPGSVRPDVPGDGTKGYKRESLVDLWDRYFQVGTSAQPKETATSSDIQTGTPESDVPIWNRRKLKETATCAVVPDTDPGAAEGSHENEPAAYTGTDDADRARAEGAGLQDQARFPEHDNMSGSMGFRAQQRRANACSAQSSGWRGNQESRAARASWRGTCAHCREPIPASAGYTATSNGEVLHNRCVDEWIRS